MKQNLLWIWLFLLALVGCQDFMRTNHDTLSEKALTDSLKIVDSIVLKSRFNNNEFALSEANKLLNQPFVKQDPGKFAKALIILGNALMVRQMDSAYFYFSKALSIAEIINDWKLKSNAYYRISQLYFSAQNNESSLLYLDSTLTCLIKYPDNELRANVYNDLGTIKAELHDTSNAIYFFNISYGIAHDHHLYNQMGAALGNIASFEKDTNTAILKLKEALKYLKYSGGTEEARAALLINIGNYSTDNDTAIKYYYLALEEIDGSNEGKLKMITYNNLVYAFINKNELKYAQDLLVDKAIPIATRLNDYEWLGILYDTYSDVLLSMREFNKAALAEKKAYKYRERAYDFKVTGQVRLLASLLDVKNKELRLSQSEKNVQLKSNKIKLVIFISSILIILTISIIFWLIQKNRTHSEKQRLISAGKIIQLEENAKGRLALELHDMTSPIYTSLLKQIEDVDIPDSEIKEYLQTSLTTLAERIRMISHKMSGTYIGQLSFHEILDGLRDEMQYRTEAQINLKSDGFVNSLYPEMANHLIRIIQELLTNGVKYVKKGEINLELAGNNFGLVLKYSDNGAGFIPSEVTNGGLGITSIYERSKLLNGKATLKSSFHKGTTWEIFIPVTAKNTKVI